MHCENTRLEDNLARLGTACMDPMMSVNYMVPSMELSPIMELSKEDELIDDDDQMLIRVVCGKVFENSKELMAVVKDSTDNVAPPQMVEMAASDQASSSMISGGKKHKTVITEAPPLDPVREVCMPFDLSPSLSFYLYISWLPFWNFGDNYFGTFDEMNL